MNLRARAFPFVLPLLLLAATEAFVGPSPVTTTRTTTTTCTTTLLQSTGSSSSSSSGNTSIEEDLARLQHEYKILQERLMDDIIRKHDEVDAGKVEALMVEIATEATKLHEAKQREIMNEAEHLKHDAQVARDRAMQLKQQETKEVDARLVDELQLAYEDLVRYSDYKEFEATSQLEAAKTLLGELQENEKRLQATLETLKHHNEEVAEEVHTRHRSFLDNVKGAILSHPEIMINLDPHIL